MDELLQENSADIARSRAYVALDAKIFNSPVPEPEPEPEPEDEPE